MKIVITGYLYHHQPTHSVSEPLVKQLARHPVVGPHIHKAILLDEVYDRQWDQLRQELDGTEDAIVCFGQASPHHRTVRLEAIARNWDGAHEPDDEGKRKVGPILENGIPFVPSSLPLHQIAQELWEAKIPWAYSQDAGGHTCNNLFYHLMVEYQGDKAKPRGFIHIPEISAEWTLEKVVEAGVRVLEGILEPNTL